MYANLFLDLKDLAICLSESSERPQEKTYPDFPVDRSKLWLTLRDPLPS